jgi:predicted sulfurtransferase
MSLVFDYKYNGNKLYYLVDTARLYLLRALRHENLTPRKTTQSSKIAATMTTTTVAAMPTAETEDDHLLSVDGDQVDEDSCKNHDEWRIALYYCYIPLQEHVSQHVAFHQSLCLELHLLGRIRVSPEGINGVLSGTYLQLQEYEKRVVEELASLVDPSEWELDVKYCQLRRDLSVSEQLFDSLSIKATTQVVSLLEVDASFNNNKDNGEKGSKNKSGYSGGRRRKKRQERQQHNPDTAKAQQVFARSLKAHVPAPHLSPDEWNTQLQELSTQDDKNVVLLDCRNVYESNVGYFSVNGTSTVKTNTRKYSELPQVLLQQKERLAESSHVFMYCTGGVRCERASLFLQAMLEEETDQPPHIYQLHGGIQKYLENSITDTESSDEGTLFRGKNFVFDPRRTDPVATKTIVGQCLVCQKPHDDYDNGHAPAAGREARCWNCRILILVCNECRPTVSCWIQTDKSDGNEDNGKGGSSSDLPRMYCGGLEQPCVHMPPVQEILNKEPCL